MGLQEYKQKRHFQRTPEPEGKTARRRGLSYVIQKHDASHLHYDFRLEWDGVLKSWAVPKGPSLDPSVKRLAVQVEDHPVAYGTFEGIIPAGEYGGGTVMLWDRGTWEPLGDAGKDLESGRLKFRVHGEKLHGAWMLVRTRGSGQYGTGKPQWLLVKERDEHARPEYEGDVLLEHPASVKTGRTMAQIAGQQDAVWNSKLRGGRTRRTTAAMARKPREHADGTATKSQTAGKLPADRDLLEGMNRYDVRKESLGGVRLTSPEKLLYPEEGVTKLELAAYYQLVAKWMLPHVKGRPVVLVRCPEGRQGECFYQKHPAVGTPDTLRTIPVKGKKTEPFVVVDDVKSLIALAQVSALEVHAWGSREDDLHRPDRLIFDLDPDVALPWARVVKAAAQVRGLLKELGLETFVKTTGGKGLHVVVPIARRHEWEEVKTFCRLVADLIVKFDPGHYTANMAKAERPGKIYVDYLRNAWEATAIAPYSTRARPGAPVAVPVRWEELDDIPGGNHFTVRSLPERLRRLRRDPWAGMKSVRQGLKEPLKKLRLVLPG